MKNITFLKTTCFIFICLTAIPLQAQRTTKWSGKWKNGLPYLGNASYYYYSDLNNGNKIMHGAFKYDVRYTFEFSRFNQKITGTYNQNLKNGVWNYHTDFKDIELAKIDDYATGAINLIASYKDGVPNGKWEFSYQVKTRDVSEFVNGRAKYTEFTPAKTITLKMYFNEGILADTFHLNINNKEIIDGVFDYFGFYHGKWIYQNNGKTVSHNYTHGRADNRVEWNDKVTVLWTSIKEKKYQDIISTRVANFDGIYDLPYTMDTISIFKANSNPINENIKKYIFDNPYLLFNYIPGDMLGYDGLTGGFKFDIVNQVTREEKQKLEIIDALTTSMILNSNKGTYFKNTYKEFSNEKISLLKTITIYGKIAEKYQCMAHNIVLHEDINEGQIKADLACKGIIELIEPLPKFSSKAQALDYFTDELNKKLEISNNTLKSIEF